MSIMVECDECNGTGKEICVNPDHGFIAAIGQAHGCPLCGWDDLHRIPNTVCDKCNGTGQIKE